MKNNDRRFGFSVVEMVISVVITSLLLLMVYQFFIEAGYQMQSGISSLESLDEARMAINYLRRDFSTACPFLSQDSDTSSKDPEHEFAAKNLVRRMVFYQDLSFIQPPEIRPQMNLLSSQSYPLQYSREAADCLRFFHFNFRGSEKTSVPLVEQVEYVFDPARKILMRKVGGRTIEFSGMEKVGFRFFVPEWAPDCVMLKIDLEVRNVPKHLRAKMPGKIVRLSTTVNSQFISSNLFEPNWNFEAYQKKL